MTLRKDETVLMVALQLTGGFMGTLSELELGSVDMKKLDYQWFVEIINNFVAEKMRN
jgi:hypothetical protein